ncbi:histone-lysine N-methyltransferase SETD7 [Elysia marginata]|uniref:Histone-lysine N-methyltransferase SETD7 n=1 Tax=Elysia marginata TaxID=1093978 RepID=A0AAV4I4F1_9GAST|nr:histone-lysine N-methyltransferase SETD7 [Elysia marginata]
MEWLANHMGHELNIHRDFYRLHEFTVEIAKVSRMLMAIDAGQARRYTGKSLNEIGLEDIAFQPEELGQAVGENATKEATTCDTEQEELLPEISGTADSEPLATAKKRKRIMSSLDSGPDEEITQV